ncbi:Uncharacterized protein SCF082_LOCUS28155 [Durusdinium trenchii]|uniref:Uncharacterized protein n=1 Tax=Durusdinium trenchii TaxID=1381693 RepID=A0ABP0MJC2_9DINO
MAILEPSMTSRLRRMSESHVFDINDWKTRMADLQGIMSAAKALFLLLETHHEAIVRVALELALEPEVMRIFAWENWYQESQRRESFRKKAGWWSPRLSEFEANELRKSLIWSVSFQKSLAQ